MARVRRVIGNVPLPTEGNNDLGELYRSHSAWLKQIVRRRGNPEIVDDVVQDTFLRAAVYAGAEPIKHPRALLLKIAQNVMCTGSRAALAARRTPPITREQSDEAAVSADQFEAFVLKQTILALPEIYRDVFMLSRFGGMTYAEIADARGISVKTVEWRMSRALAMCAARMRE